MADSNKPRAWSRNRVLAVVIPLAALVIALAAILVVILVGGSDGGNLADPAGQDELTAMYEEIKKEADEAVKQMEDLESQQALEDAETYEQELYEAYAAMNELYQDLEDAAQATEEAANQVSDTSESYEVLYQEMLAYYDYLAQVCDQAAAQIQYLQSVAPTLEELHQLENVVDRLKRLPAAGAQVNELSAQLISCAAGAGDSYQGTLSAPDSLGTFSSGLSALTGQIEGLAQQMSRALAEGDQQALTTYAQQLDAGISSLEQQLTGDLSAVVNEFSSQIQSLSAAVNTALP